MENVNEIIKLNIAKHATKASSSPPAQSTKLCELVKGFLAKIFGQKEEFYNKYDGNVVLSLITLFQILYAMRISEILNIDCRKLKINQICIIKGSKGSNDIIITDMFLIELLTYYKVNQINIFDGISRFYVYREYKKMNIQTLGGGIINNAVTHTFRHNLAKKVREMGLDNSVVTKVLNHKNKNSQKGYGNK